VYRQNIKMQVQPTFKLRSMSKQARTAQSV